MKSEYWKQVWNKSAATEDFDVRLVSGWGNIPFHEMLFIINDIIMKLDLSENDILLDAGCGAGLFEIAFAYRAKEIYAIDYSENMVRETKKNNIYDNVHVSIGNIKKLEYKDGFFDKVLVNSIIQYLNNIQEVEVALSELIRTTRAGGKILLSLIPDLDKKKEFVEGYRYLGLSEEQIKLKIESADQCLWFKQEQIMELINNMGVKSVKKLTPFNSFQKKYYFDILIER